MAGSDPGHFCFGRQGGRHAKSLAAGGRDQEIADQGAELAGRDRLVKNVESAVICEPHAIGRCISGNEDGRNSLTQQTLHALDDFRSVLAGAQTIVAENDRGRASDRPSNSRSSSPDVAATTSASHPDSIVRIPQPTNHRQRLQSPYLEEFWRRSPESKPLEQVELSGRRLPRSAET